MKEISLYVGCYTDNNPGIYHLSYDPSENEFAILSTDSETANPSFLVRQGDFLFAANESEDGSQLSSYRIDEESGALHYVNTVEAEGTVCCHVTAGEKAVFGSNYGTGNLYGVETERGEFGEVTAQEWHLGEQPRAHSTILSLEGTHLLCCDLGLDRVYSYGVGKTGQLTPHPTKAYLQLPKGGGPRHMAFHPQGHLVCVVTEYSNQIHTLGYKEGVLTLEGTVTMPVSGETKAFGADIHIHPNGQFLYASLRGPNTIVAYEMAEEGTLQLVGEYPTGGDWPRNFAISSQGKHLFVANQRSDEITVCGIDVKTGALTKALARIAIPTPACVIQR